MVRVWLIRLLETLNTELTNDQEASHKFLGQPHADSANEPEFFDLADEF
jgi:hypothetical protein